MADSLSGIVSNNWRQNLQGISILSIKHSLSGLDWNLVKSSAVLSIGMALARILGLAFSLVLAGALTPTDFGAVQYGITLSMIVAIGTMPFGQHVLARFIGRYKDDAEQLGQIMANAWIIMAGLFGLTLLVSVPVLNAIDQLNIGILTIFGGVTLFYVYWGVSSGFQAPIRLTSAYLGSNIIQIVLICIAVYVFNIRSPLLALVIYGASYLLPVAILQRYWPLAVDLQLSHLRRHVSLKLLRFFWPIWASHAGFMLYSSIDILLLVRYSGQTAVGVYALANTLSQVFLFIPVGIATFLMPKAAAVSSQSYHRPLEKTVVLSLIINAGILIVYLGIVKWFVQSVFGLEYFVGMGIYIILAVRRIVAGVHTLITSVLVGRGKPGIETISRWVAVLIIAVSGFLLIPYYGPQGAAIAGLAGVLGSLITYAVFAGINKL